MAAALASSGRVRSETWRQDGHHQSLHRRRWKSGAAAEIKKHNDGASPFSKANDCRGGYNGDWARWLVVVCPSSVARLDCCRGCRKKRRNFSIQTGFIAEPGGSFGKLHGRHSA